MHNKTTSDKWFSFVNGSLLFLIATAMLFPLLYIFSVSFSSYTDFVTKDIILWPSHWDFGAYQFVLSSKPFLKAIVFSCYITVLGTFVNLLFSSTMAYALTYWFIGQKPLLVLVLVSLLFSPGLIPNYLVVKELGLIDSIWALILPVAISPFNLIVIRQFFLAVPKELSEAAIMDGANPLQIFSRIFLPLSKPVLAAFGLFYAVGHWNSYFSAIIYMNNPEKWPIQVILRLIVIVNKPDFGTSLAAIENPPPPETIQMAAIFLATVPILVVYPFLQKHFAKGVMLGSIKG
jgi:putative aldouronate transport system permease protein